MRKNLKLVLIALLIGFVLIQPFLIAQSRTQNSLQQISDSTGNFYISNQKGNSSLIIFNTENVQEIYNITLRINVTLGGPVVVSYQNENFVVLSEVVEHPPYQVLNFNASNIVLGRRGIDPVSGTYELFVEDRIPATGKPDISPAATLLGFISDYFLFLIGGIAAGAAILIYFIKNKI